MAKNGVIRSKKPDLIEKIQKFQKKHGGGVWITANWVFQTILKLNYSNQ